MINYEFNDFLSKEKNRTTFSAENKDWNSFVAHFYGKQK
jgi:hypothetical protein